ncbi:MAG: hypothetical protein JNK05_13640 [Myxococcales bacterium]|nr:hypothetical protein [Myxococcales bacterium]
MKLRYGSVMLLCASCASEPSQDASVRDVTTRDAADPGDASDSGARDVAIDTAPAEQCNNLDDDLDGTVDEDCPCTQGATQSCYPALAFINNCPRGMQSCGADQRWGACTGAILPRPGRAECCPALGPTPPHPVLDDFVTTYRGFAMMPGTSAAVGTFMPRTTMYRMVFARVVVGNEFIDATRGGVTEANILAGLAAAKMGAITNLGVPMGSVLHTSETMPVLDGSGRDGRGYAFGSILYRTPDGGVREAVYLYFGLNRNGDAEGFYHSEVTVEACEPGSIPG